MNELKSLLEKTSDSYEDYVLYMMALVRDKPDLEKTFIMFLKENPDATAEQVMDYSDDFLFDENGELFPEFRCVD